MCDRCKGQDTGDLLAGWLNKLYAHLADKGITLIDSSAGTTYKLS